MAPPPAWAAGAAGLAFDGLVLSFQLYLPAAGVAPGVPPPSLGAVRPRPGPGGEYLVPLREDEAVWIGLVREGRGAAPRLAALGWLGGHAHDLRSGRRVAAGRAPTPACAPVETWPGLKRRRGGWRPFALAEAGGCERLEFRAARDGGPGFARARVRLVPPAEFEARTGCPAPPPADPAAGYRGWRLP